MLLPLSVMAMTPVSDSTLSDVTGQAGVNINADLTMDITMGTVAWGDDDGIGLLGTVFGWESPTTGGYVGIQNLTISNLRIKARETDGYDGYTTAKLKPITIDVARDTAGTPLLYGGATFVRIGFGALQITMDELSMTVALGHRVTDPTNSATPVQLNEMLGSVNLGSLGLYIDPDSYVDIYNRSGGATQGVNFTLNFKIDKFALSYVSWGDDDGCTNLGAFGTPDGSQRWISASTAGYVGLRGLSVGTIEIIGTVRIDIAGDTAGSYNVHSGNASTVVHIGFGDGVNPFKVNVNGPIWADVVLAGDKDLTATSARTLGDIYISTFNLEIENGSWVDIWAH